MKPAHFLLPLAALCAFSPAMAQRFGGGDGTQIFESADANHDGVVTRAEFLAARNARFDRMDRNGDGVIDRSDFARLASFRPQAMGRIDALIAQADANHDGKVTRAELAAAPAQAFDLADANHDGKVDRDELAAARATVSAMRGNGR